MSREIALGRRGEEGDWLILGVVAFGVVEILNGFGVVRHPLGRFGLALGYGWGIERVLAGREAQCQKNRYLDRLLAQAGESYQTLQQEAQEFERYANGENQRLEEQNLRLEAEYRSLVEGRDDLQVEVWDLEEQLKDLTDWRNEAEGDDQHVLNEVNLDPSGDVQCLDICDETAGFKTPDLSNMEVAIVGGHPSMRRSVLKELRMTHGLRQGIEIPPMSEARVNQQQLRAQLDQCDLIAIVTGYMSHPLTHMIMDLKQANALTGKVVLLQRRGKTGVLRDVLNCFS